MAGDFIGGGEEKTHLKRRLRGSQHSLPSTLATMLPDRLMRFIGRRDAIAIARFALTIGVVPEHLTGIHLRWWHGGCPGSGPHGLAHEGVATRQRLGTAMLDHDPLPVTAPAAASCTLRRPPDGGPPLIGEARGAGCPLMTHGLGNHSRPVGTCMLWKCLSLHRRSRRDEDSDSGVPMCAPAFGRADITAWRLAYSATPIRLRACGALRWAAPAGVVPAAVPHSSLGVGQERGKKEGH